jgi:hypothetical protein
MLNIKLGKLNKLEHSWTDLSVPIVIYYVVHKESEEFQGMFIIHHKTEFILKIRLSLDLIKNHAMKAYEGVTM